MDPSQGTLTPVGNAPEFADSGTLTPVNGAPDLATKPADGGGTLTQVDQPPRIVPSWFDDKAARFVLGITKTVGNFMQSADSAVQAIAPSLVSAQDSQAVQQADAQSHAILNQVEAGNDSLGGGLVPTLNVNPDMANDVGANAAQAAGSLLASVGATGGNLIPMTAFSAAAAFSEGKNAALDAGKSDDEADEAGAKAAGWASIALPAYAVTGKIARALLSPILKTTNPLLRFGASTAAASVANVGTSAALRSAQGDDATPDAVSLTQDLIFGGLHGIHEAGAPGEVVRAKVALDNIERNYDIGANAVQDGTMSSEDYDAFVAKTQDTWNGLNSFLSKPENQRILEMQQAKGAEVDAAQDVGPATAAAADEEPIDLASAQEQAPGESPTDEVPAPGTDETPISEQPTDSPAQSFDEFREMAARGNLVKNDPNKSQFPEDILSGYAKGKISGYSEDDIAHWYAGLFGDSDVGMDLAYDRYSQHVAHFLNKQSSNPEYGVPGYGGYGESPEVEKMQEEQSAQPPSEQPIQGLGNATQQEFRVQRTIDGATVFRGLKKSKDEEPSYGAWRTNFERIHPDLEDADYEDLYKRSKDASDAYDLAGRMKPMEDVVSQQEGLQRTWEGSASIKNEDVDEAMHERGLSAAESAGKRDFGTIWEDAAKRETADPSVSYYLVQDLLKKPRAVDDVENALLLRRQITVQNEFDHVVRMLNAAHDSGNENLAAEMTIRRARMSDELQDIASVLKSTGTEGARGLGSRRLIANRNYSLQKMIERTRDSLGNRKLTPQETEDVAKKAKALKEVQYAEAKRLAAAKARAQRRIEELKGKVENGDFTRKQKPEPVEPDKELLDLQAKKKRLQEEFERGIERNNQAQRSRPYRGADLLSKLSRAWILSSAGIVKKLAVYNALRLVISPIEEAIGGGLSKFPGIQRIAEQAPRHGGFNSKIEADAIAKTFTTMIGEMKRDIVTGRSSISEKYGPIEKNTPAWYDYVTHFHVALHEPARLQEFHRSVAKRLAFAARNGVDTTEPAVDAKIMMDAFSDYNRAGFLQDNRWAKAFRAWVKTAQAESGDSQFGEMYKYLDPAVTTEFPVMKLASNVVQEGLEYAVGSVFGSIRAANAILKDVKLKPEEADLIMRLLKKGTVGALGWAVGILAYKNISGFYQKGKTGKNNPADTVTIGGQKLGPEYTHSPFFLPMMMGATAMNVALSKAKKGDRENQGAITGISRALLGAFEGLPGVDTTADLLGAITDTQKASSVGHALVGRAVPGLLSNVATHGLPLTAGVLGDLDKEGNVIPRQINSTEDQIKSEIPGLRQQLQQKKQKR